jgi:hypothetical protein
VVKIAIMTAIPFVIVFDAAMATIPIAREKLLTIVMRADPVGTLVRRTRPVTFMPAIMPADGIPISVNPGKTRSGRSGMHGHNSRRRRRSEVDANANLSAQTESAR